MLCVNTARYVTQTGVSLRSQEWNRRKAVIAAAEAAEGRTEELEDFDDSEEFLTEHPGSDG